MLFKQPQIDQYIKKPDNNIRGFLIYGENLGLVSTTVKNLIKTVSQDEFDAFNVAHINSEDATKDFGLLQSEYNAVSMMGDKRVVILNDATDGITKDIPSLFASNSNTLLILSASSLTKSSSLVKLFEKEDFLVSFPCYDDKSEDIIKATKDKISSQGFSINPDALGLLVSRLSTDRLSSLSEIEKLLIYMGEKKNISIENVTACVSDVGTSSIEDICYATALGDHIKAQKSLDKLLKEGTDPSTIVTFLSMHFYKLMSICALIEDGFSTEDALKKVMPRLLWLKKDAFLLQVRAWRKEKLLQINELLYNTQKDLRTTSMPVEEIVSYLLMQIASAYKR